MEDRKIDWVLSRVAVFSIGFFFFHSKPETKSCSEL